MKKIAKKMIYGWMLAIVAVSISACTKYDTPPATAVDKPDTEDNKVRRRVLWINIDGAVGQVVQENQPANIKAMLSHSKYTFQALADNRILEDDKAEDPINWTTLLTGTISEKHKVRDGSYIPDLDVNPSNPNQQVVYFPNVISRILEALPNAKTFCVTPWKNLNENMLNNTFRTTTSSSDEETRNLVKASLEKEDMNFTLVSFKGMLDAGKTGGFASSNANYLAALKKIDGYIGEFLKAIEGRKDAQKEDWLVVITSDHGGNSDGTWQGASKSERNNLCIFYYNHYSAQEMKGETMYGAYFNSSLNGKISDPNQFYSAGEGKSLSVEFMLRMEPRTDGSYNGYNWDRIMGKRSWGLFRKNGNIVFYMDPGENGVTNIERGTDAFNNSLWHSFQLGITADTKTSKSYVMLYDGELKVRASSNTAGYIEDKNDLQIGGTGVPTPYYIAEMRIWDSALDEKTYQENSSLLNIPTTNPNYKKLLGYWKFKPESLLSDGKTIKNEIEGKPNLVFNSTPRIAEFANTLPQKRKSGNLIMENTMVTPQILYWLNANPSVQLDGFAFLENFNLEEGWRE
jgi:hypothetical protein